MQPAASCGPLQKGVTSAGLAQERNSNEDTAAWQCGRPDPRSIPTNSAPLDADESGGTAYSEEEMVSCSIWFG